MPEAHQPRRVRPDYIQEGVLRSLGQPGARARLGEDALVEDPDADLGVLVGAPGVAGGPGGVELPGEGGAGGADLVDEVVVLEGLGAGDLLDRRLHGLLDDRAGLGEGLGQGLHVEGHRRRADREKNDARSGADLRARAGADRRSRPPDRS